ncbi:hypothetical protein RND71_014542 [Anisodus tanguticus]|uniref:Cupin type-1 domain-containing protein n=1 Tax=Anisodus tanguticus TaxID=243964 RepID=A0AAE1SBZ2_9SOLA|nr:hypothetical protein RND71_014542 [Anisodus tanguticus]
MRCRRKRGDAGFQMPEPNEGHRDGMVLNCEKAPLDVDIKVGQVGLGVDLVRLYGSAMRTPGFSCDSALQVTYIVRGSGRVQVVGVDGKRVLETHIKAGNLFIVLRFFVVSKIGDPDDMEWFSIITTPNPMFTHLAGRTSTWPELRPSYSSSFDSPNQQTNQSAENSFSPCFELVARAFAAATPPAGIVALYTGRKSNCPIYLRVTVVRNIWNVRSIIESELSETAKFTEVLSVRSYLILYEKKVNTELHNNNYKIFEIEFYMTIDKHKERRLTSSSFKCRFSKLSQICRATMQRCKSSHYDKNDITKEKMSRGKNVESIYNTAKQAKFNYEDKDKE